MAAAVTVQFPTHDLTFALPKCRVALWNVNPYCNLECDYCYGSFDGASFKQTGHRPPTLAGPELARTAELLRAREVDVLYLGGGEPLLRKDLSDLIDAVFGRGVAVRITTNLTVLPAAFLERFAGGQISRVSVSLDSLDAEYNNLVRGRTAVVRRHIDGLMSLKSADSAALGLYCVVTAENLGHVPELLGWAIANGFDYFSCQPVALPQSHPLMPRLALKSEHNAQLLELFDQLRAARATIQTPGEVYLQLWESLLSHDRGVVAACPAGAHLLYVSESGEVWRCPAYDVTSREKPLFRIDGPNAGPVVSAPCGYLSYDCLCMWELMYPYENAVVKMGP